MEQIKGIVQPKMKITPSTYSCFVFNSLMFTEVNTATAELPQLMKKNLNEFKS